MPSSDIPKPPTDHEVLIDALRAVMAPLARLAVARGLTHANAEEVLKQAESKLPAGDQILFERGVDKDSGREVARGKTGVVFVGDAPEGGKKVAPLPAAFHARLQAHGHGTPA